MLEQSMTAQTVGTAFELLLDLFGDARPVPPLVDDGTQAECRRVPQLVM